MANSDGSEAMLNRVMTKDNIGVAVVLEVHKELFGTGQCLLNSVKDKDSRLLISQQKNKTLFITKLFSFVNC